MMRKVFLELIKYRRWRLVIEEALESLVANKTWDYVQKPDNINPVTTQWVLNMKMLLSRQVDWQKTWPVAWGFTQRKKEDFFEILSGVNRLDLLCIFSAISTIMDL